MFLFLQNWRYTIPTIVVPWALLGTFARCWRWAFDQRADHVRHGAGDRHRGRRRHRGGRERRAYHEHRRACRWRPRKAMGQISGAIVGITVVLVRCSCRWPFSGAVGNIYRQFAAVMGGVHGFSASWLVHAARCAPRCSPVKAGPPPEKGDSSAGSTAASRAAPGLRGLAGRASLPRAGRALLVYGAIVAAGALHCGCPPLPAQRGPGHMLVNCAAAAGATRAHLRGDAAGRGHAGAARGGRHGRVMGFSFRAGPERGASPSSR